MPKEYIEREALIEELKRRDFLPVIVKHAIEAVPAADVAPVVHGRWEKWNGDNRHHCTVCECYANEERDAYGYITSEFLDNYCPNCGAMMDKEEE